jgi:hypothetical protein
MTATSVSLRRTLTVLLGVALAAGLVWPPVGGSADLVLAGRRYSSGGFSFGKSGSAGGRTFTHGGKSYSSGGSRPSFSGGSRPSYSSGSRPAPSFTPPKSPTVTPPSGGRPTYTAPPPLPSPSGSAPRLGGRQYSSGTRTAPAGSGPGNQPGPSYDVNAGRAARQQEGKETYRRYTSPGRSGSWGTPPPAPPQRPAVLQGPRAAPSYTDNSGKQQPIDPRDARIDELRRQLDHERWVNRRQREQQFYRDWWSRPPVITYHDAYNPFFDYWLLRQSLDTQALWLYNHRDTMDQQRYQDLVQKDRALEERVRQLEAAKRPRDPTYTPPGVPPDLMYNDSYARSAYNPQQVQPPAPLPAGAHPTNFWPVFLTTLVVVLLIGFVVWLVFIQRWGGTPDEPPASRPPERTGQP